MRRSSYAWGGSPNTLPQFSFRNAASSYSEDAGTVAVSVELSFDPGVELTVNFTEAGVASGADTTLSPAASLVFPSGVLTQNIDVTLNAVLNGARDLVITLTDVDGELAEIGNIPQHTMSIGDSADLGLVIGLADGVSFTDAIPTVALQLPVTLSNGTDTGWIGTDGTILQVEDSGGTLVDVELS